MTAHLTPRQHESLEDLETWQRLFAIAGDIRQGTVTGCVRNGNAFLVSLDTGHILSLTFEGWQVLLTPQPVQQEGTP